MRSDGRRLVQARQTRIQPAVLLTAEGSALIECGHTKVLCAASVEDRVPRWLRGSGNGWVTAEYGMLPRSTSTRRAREGLKGRPSGRTAEIQRLIGRSLRTAVDRSLLGDRTIIVDCDVLQADGGTRTASITGGWVALALAIQGLAGCGTVSPGALSGQVAAISVGLVEGRPMLDLCYEEDARAEVDMNVVMNSEGDFVDVQASAEERVFARGQLDDLLTLAQDGIRPLMAAQSRLVDIWNDA